MAEDEEVFDPTEEVEEEAAVDEEPEGETLEELYEKEKARNASFEGIVNQEQEKARRYEAALAAQGLELDEKGQIVQSQRWYGNQTAQPTTQGYQPQTPTEPEDFDPFNKEQFDRAVERKVQEALSVVVPGVVAPQEFILDRTLATEYPDWKDIGGEVKGKLKQYGFTSITHAIQLGQGQLVEDVVYSIRGRRAALNPTTPAPVEPTPEEIEAERQRRLAAVTPTGPAGGSKSDGWEEFDAGERQWAKDQGVTDPKIARMILSKGELTIGGGS